MLTQREDSQIAYKPRLNRIQRILLGKVEGTFKCVAPEKKENSKPMQVPSPASKGGCFLKTNDLRKVP